MPGFGVGMGTSTISVSPLRRFWRSCFIGKSRGKFEREIREGKSRGEIGGIGIEIPRDNSSIPQV
jgi:hypothetical protein